MSNSRFTQGAPSYPHTGIRQTDTPRATLESANGAPMQRVGNIIGPQWLAHQMGLPVEDVQERLERAWKEEEWLATSQQ